DIEGDPRMEPWRERALACGFRASAAFPLCSGGRTVGVLNLYASLPRFFDAELVSLLDQLARDISFALDRLALQAERDAAERRFRATVDHAADAVFIADLDGRIVDANIRACESLGYAREELLELRIGDVDPEVAAMGEDVGRVFRAAAVAGSQVVLGRHRRKDGSVFPVEVRVAGVRLADGDYVIGMARDITERLRAEQALRESERRFRQISRAMSDIAYSCRRAADGSLEIDWMMGAAERITGYTADEIVDMRCWECLVAPEDLELFRRQVIGLAPGRSGRCELRLRRKDGGIAWVRSVAECVAEADGANQEAGGPAAHRLYGGLVDITARKQADADLRESEARLRRVVDEMPVMLDAFDGEGRLVYWNRECERVTGYPAEQMLGNPDALALLYPDAGYRERMLAEYRSRGLDSRGFEWDLVARDGSVRRIAWSNISAVVPIPGWAAWGVGVDVTAWRQAEAAASTNAQRLRLLSRRLLSVQEDERRALARELHDEVGQQLAALKINLDMLLRGGGAELDRRRLSDSIEIADQTIERIRDTALNLLPAVLEDLGLTSALNWYARRQAERSGCRIQVGSSIPPLAKDVETALFRIVQEAVNNAIRHGAAGRIEVALDMVGDAVRVSVHDDGRGFDVGDSAATGVGLLSMRERTELLGGQFEVQSRVGGGTWVRARIPLETPPD
ncbi:MAG TPA: PAS domain S-box protein, partial [Rhodocyclaceae bacterium]|nr:PAS domain S-box protein [Rhodocyclaceae bacterium]